MNIFDLAFVGSGMSCVSVMIELLSELCLFGVVLSKPLKIAVVEKRPQLWTGLPYGDRSTVNCLTITTLRDFLTDPKRLEAFHAWLDANQETWLGEYRRLGGEVAEAWCARNQEEIALKDFRDIPIPRYLYGKYKSEQLQQLIVQAQDRGVVEITPICGSAFGIGKDPDFRIQIRNAQGEEFAIRSRKVVMATGHLPARKLPQLESVAPSHRIGSLYDPDLSANISLIREGLLRVRNPEHRNLLLIGSNSSSVELINLIHNDSSLSSLVNKVVVCSPSGKFPMASARREHMPDFLELAAFEKVNSPEPQAVLEAMLREFENHFSDEVCMASLGELFKKVRHLLKALDEKQYAKFLLTHGDVITRKLRRIAKHNLQAVKEMLGTKRLEIVAGETKDLETVEVDGDELLKFRYADSSQCIQEMDVLFESVVSCIGFESVSECSSPFLKEALAKGFCRINASGKGIEVNDGFEASENFYVNGPLIAGNLNETVNYWHLENVSRIMGIAPLLCRSLLSSEGMKEAERVSLGNGRKVSA